MRSTWKLLKIFGVSIELHISFIIFMLLFLLFDWTFLLVLLVLFASITLHELSHALIAKMSGITVKKIVLLPIGGMAAMDETIIKPYSEFKMAIAGPLFNYTLCALVLIVLHLTGWQLMLNWADWNAVIEGTISVPLSMLIVSSAFWLNWLLGSFNLFVPAIPLDGGRVFRSALALFMDYVNATRIATTVSTVITIFLFIYALLTFNILLVVISAFVYLGAVSELEYALSNKLLAHFPLSKLVRQNYIIMSPRKHLDKALEEMIASRSLVVFTRTSEDHVEQVSLYDIRHVPKAKWKKTTIGEVARKVTPVDINDPLTPVMRSMARRGLEAVPIVKKGEITGVVFRDDIDRVFEILKVSNA